MERDQFYDDWDLEFIDFCANALNGWALEQTKRDPNLCECQKRLSDLESQMESLLGENKSLVQKYSEMKNALDSCSTIPNYLQGYRDCLFLLHKLELI